MVEIYRTLLLCILQSFVLSEFTQSQVEPGDSSKNDCACSVGSIRTICPKESTKKQLSDEILGTLKAGTVILSIACAEQIKLITCSGMRIAFVAHVQTFLMLVLNWLRLLRAPSRHQDITSLDVKSLFCGMLRFAWARTQAKPGQCALETIWYESLAVLILWAQKGPTAKGTRALFTRSILVALSV